MPTTLTPTRPSTATPARNPTAGVRQSFLLGEIRGHAHTLDVGVRGRVLADLFLEQSALPGVLLTDGGAIVGAITRRGYLDLIGRYCGMDLYHPRPLRLMADRLVRERGQVLELPESTLVDEAVRRGLERPRELIYEPIVVVGESVRLVDFEDVLLADSEQTARRNTTMRQILATVREGLLLVDRNGQIGQEHSVAALRLLGRESFHGLAFPELIAQLLGVEAGVLAAGYLETLFSRRVVEGLVEQINPLRSVELHEPAGGSRRLAFRFVRGMVGCEIRHLLVHVEDTTQRDLLAQQIALERRRADERVEVALALVGADPEAVTGLRSLLELVAHELSQPRAATGEHQLARSLHRIKGEAGMLGLVTVRELAHSLEGALPNGDVEGLRERLVAATADLGELVDRFIRLGVASGESRANRAPASIDSAPAGTEPASLDPVDQLVRSAEVLALEVAAAMGKQLRFVAATETERFPAAVRALARGAVPQLVRNAVVHGLERPADRRRAGKPEIGTVQLRLRSHVGGWHEIVVQDDGRGLDEDQLRRRGVALGLPSQLLANPRGLIFVPGFSTAQSVDIHAGRGVGLDLVRAEVEAAGGRIEVHSEPGAWCALRLLVPEPSP